MYVGAGASGKAMTDERSKKYEAGLREALEAGIRVNTVGMFRAETDSKGLEIENIFE